MMYMNTRRRLKYVEESSVQPMCNYHIKHKNIVILLLLLFFKTLLDIEILNIKRVSIGVYLRRSCS